MLEKKTSRKKRLLRLGLVVCLISLLAFAAVYVYVNNTLVSALSRSLSTFRPISVTYPSIEPESIELNITFSLENPSDYSITVNLISLSFTVDNHPILGVNVSLSHELPSGEDTYFHTGQRVTNMEAIRTLQNQTYMLRGNGRITATSQHLFVQARWERRVVFAKNATGIS